MLFKESKKSCQTPDDMPVSDSFLFLIFSAIFSFSVFLPEQSDRMCRYPFFMTGKSKPFLGGRLYIYLIYV